MAPKRQNAELERLRLACNVDSTETITKAQEILRRMDTKCRPGTLGRGDLFRTCIAFDLACRALNCPVPQKTAVKLCGAPSESVYVAALGTAQRLLGVQRRYTCKEIAESVGDKSAGMKAAVELKRYKERFLASYPVRQVSGIDLDGTVYAVAAFYLCAKKLKHPVDKQRLLDLSLVREDEFMAVCRSMLDLCYSTLGVSVSDKPTAERLSRFQKAAALNNKNNGSSSAPSGVKDEQRPQGSAAQGPARSATLASSGPQRRNGGGFAASGNRRRIPLSGGRERLGAPGSHVTALARSIQAATQRKRHGGMTVAPLEPGGSNEASDSLNDRTHHRPATKRPRPTADATEAAAAPPAEPAGGGPEPHDSAACSSATVPARCTAPAPPRAAVCNPHATAATASPAAAVAATVSGSGVDNGSAAAVRSASRAPPAAVHNPYAPKPCAAVRNPYAGSGKGSGGRGRAGGDGSRRGGCVGGTGPRAGGEGPRGDEEYTAWKQRVLASMENRMKETLVKEDADSSSPAASTAVPAFSGGGGGGGGGGGDAPGGGSESSQRDNAPAAAAIVPEDPSAPEAASPAAALPATPSNDSPEARAAATPRSSTKNKSKQPSLMSFFTPGGGGQDKNES